MKAIRVHEFGGPEVLRLEEVVTPKPSAGDVLVRIHAAGVNPYDTYMRAGTYAVKPALPYTPGSDGAGIVEAVGESVKKVKRNDRVYTGRTLTGAYAGIRTRPRRASARSSGEKSISSKEQESGYRTEQLTMRCITQPKRMPPKLCWCTAKVAVWALRHSKSRAL